jgi:quercetin dioxygenase-like cupin family protein
MADREAPNLVLENRHTGERLVLRRVSKNGEVWLELNGTLPPHKQGPPMHIHFAEDEEALVRAGTLSAVIDGRRIIVRSGESTKIPRGAVHRWWNDGDEVLDVGGYAKPVVDLDRYLQAVFEILNAGPEGRPSLFYMAHAALRHRQTQAVLILPRPIQAALFRVIIAIGTVLGRYRGTEWPGCPARCLGAPTVADTATTSSVMAVTTT